MCDGCENCIYIGEGDYICDINYDFVMEDFVPTENYYECNGEDYEGDE